MGAIFDEVRKKKNLIKWNKYYINYVWDKYDVQYSYTENRYSTTTDPYYIGSVAVGSKLDNVYICTKPYIPSRYIKFNNSLKRYEYYYDGIISDDYIGINLSYYYNTYIYIWACW